LKRRSQESGVRRQKKEEEDRRQKTEDRRKEEKTEKIIETGKKVISESRKGDCGYGAGARGKPYDYR
jgi:hypothetical protein